MIVPTPTKTNAFPAIDSAFNVLLNVLIIVGVVNLTGSAKYLYAQEPPREQASEPNQSISEPPPRAATTTASC